MTFESLKKIFSKDEIKELEEIGDLLREYRKNDPDLNKSLRRFADSEAKYADPLESKLVIQNQKKQ